MSWPQHFRASICVPGYNPTFEFLDSRKTLRIQDDLLRSAQYPCTSLGMFSCGVSPIVSGVLVCTSLMYLDNRKVALIEVMPGKLG